MGLSKWLGIPSAVVVEKATATISLESPPAHTLAPMTGLRARFKSADTFPNRKIQLPSQCRQIASKEATRTDVLPGEVSPRANTRILFLTNSTV